MDDFFQEINDDDLICGRFEIIVNDAGFMPYDHDCNEFLKDENGAYCFDNYWEAASLVDDAILTMKSEV